MYKIKLFTVGKLKESWLQEGVKEYVKRLSPSLSLEWICAKKDNDLISRISCKQRLICLDIAGMLFSSEQFSKWLKKEFELSDSRLSFVIGGPEGLPEAIKSQAAASLSLSPLTFTHQLAPLILLEQIYRALQIAQGTPYHK